MNKEDFTIERAPLKKRLLFINVLSSGERFKVNRLVVVGANHHYWWMMVFAIQVQFISPIPMRSNLN